MRKMVTVWAILEDACRTMRMQDLTLTLRAEQISCYPDISRTRRASESSKGLHIYECGLCYSSTR